MPRSELPKTVDFHIAQLRNPTDAGEVVWAGAGSPAGSIAQLGVGERIDGLRGDAVTIVIHLLRCAGTAGGGLVRAVEATGAGRRGHCPAELGWCRIATLVELEKYAAKKTKGEDKDNPRSLGHG